MIFVDFNHIGGGTPIGDEPYTNNGVHLLYVYDIINNLYFNFLYRPESLVAEPLGHSNPPPPPPPIPVSQDTMIDKQSSASGHDYASDRAAIGAGFPLQKGHLNIKGY